jgi:hypothetical protein
MRQCVFLLVLGLMAGCQGGTNDSSQSSRTYSPPSGNGSVGSNLGTGSSSGGDSPEKVDVSMAAADWYAEWKKDESAAKLKYKGKVIELSGTVDRAVEDGSDRGMGWVFLVAPGAIVGFPMYTNDKDPWLRVCSGSKVKVRGVVPEFGGEPGGLWKVVLVEVGPNPGIQTTAVKLSAEFAEDLEKAKKKYVEKSKEQPHKKQLYLEGEVLDKTEDNRTFRLRGEGDWAIFCHFLDWPTKKIASLKVGTKVKVLGEVDDLVEKNKLGLYSYGIIELP